MQSTSAPQRHLPIRRDWLAATQEAALEPDRPIIDPHHHLWDRPGNRYLLHDLVEDLSSGHNIRATVFLECREMYRADGPAETRSLGETSFVAGVAAMSESGKYGSAHACAGIIGNVDFRVGSRAKGILEQHIVAGGGRFRAPAQRLGDFLAGRASDSLGPTSYRPGLSATDLAAVLPSFVAEALRAGLRQIGARLPAFLLADALLIAAETRTSAPVRFLRDPATLVSPSVEGLYPCGEGAGYAGGIVSAALDGARVAERIFALAG